MSDVSTYLLPRPPGLLLATDFAPDCDRALERSRQLAAGLALPAEVLTVYAAPQAQAQRRLLMGSRSEQLLRELDCDTLLVPHGAPDGGP